MLSKLLPSRKPSATQQPARIPPGQRIYAIGDIHGRSDLLDELLDRIAADDTARGPSETMLVFLGDLIDRGPDSSGVVDRLLSLSMLGDRSRFLLGNHEEVFLKAIFDDEIDSLRFFCRIGGRETILSYGIDESSYNAMDYAELKIALRAAVPKSHLRFLNQFEDMIEVGDYLFVHAGIRPGIPLGAQRVNDLRWIREPFLEHRAFHGRLIIHGHTITPDVDERPNRVGIDTGAYASGKLSALGIEGSSRWLLQTSKNDG